MTSILAGEPTGLDTVLIKVASRCNLDCDYCYVYNMGDDGWRAQPKRMALETGRRIAEALGAAYRRQGRPFSVVLHGGEPLLLGERSLDELCSALRHALPHPCGIDVQTNGVLLTEGILDVFARHDVGVSISMDGPGDVHDRHRTDHRGRGSHARVARALDTLRRHRFGARLFSGILAVIDPDSDPAAVYAALKETGAPSLDFLPRDGNWDRLPYGKREAASLEYGRWLERLLDVYLADEAPPRVRILDDMLRLLLGGESRKEGVGEADYAIIVIEPDGRIDKNDTLKVAQAAADRFEASWNIFDDDLADILASEAFAGYHRQQRPTADACLACPDRNICGGGMVAHRWSATSGFDNPSIFCADQRYLIAAMRDRIAASTQATKQEYADANE